eukprot:11733788-Alexandrium_andersonii.AAC.1
MSASLVGSEMCIRDSLANVLWHQRGNTSKGAVLSGSQASRNGVSFPKTSMKTAEAGGPRPTPPPSEASSALAVALCV